MFGEILVVWRNWSLPHNPSCKKAEHHFMVKLWETEQKTQKAYWFLESNKFLSTGSLLITWIIWNREIRKINQLWSLVTRTKRSHRSSVSSRLYDHQTWRSQLTCIKNKYPKLITIVVCILCYTRHTFTLTSVRIISIRNKCVSVSWEIKLNRHVIIVI